MVDRYRIHSVTDRREAWVLATKHSAGDYVRYEDYEAMRKYGRIDANQNEIVDALREHGAFVQSLASIGGGVPDLLVGYGPHWYLMEIKDGSKPPSKRRLTDDEWEWHRKADEVGCAVFTVESVEQAIGVLHVI